MTGKTKVIIGIMLAILVFIAFANGNKATPVNWTETYHLRDKIPFGLYVFDQEKFQFFNQSEESLTKVVSESPYYYFYTINEEIEKTADYLEEEYSGEEEIDSTLTEEQIKNEQLNRFSTESTSAYESAKRADSSKFNFDTYENLLYINFKQDHDDSSIQVMLDYVKAGSVAFMSCTDFSKTLLDSLKINMIYEFTPETHFVFGLYEKPSKPSKCKYQKGTYGHYFSKYDSLSTRALGYQLKNGQKKTNFIKVKYGEGEVYLHSQPVVFTNYYMLQKENYLYLSNLFKSIAPNDWLWFVKDQDLEAGQSISANPLRFIGQHPPLRWAYWLAWIGLILFIVFNSKRKQRIVPVIKPLENTTIDFAKTISNLYFQEKNYKDIIRKKIIYFLEKVRTLYHIETANLDDDFMLKLAHKSGKNEEDIKALIQLIVQLKNRGVFYEEDLIKLNKALEQNNF
jgi:hypothetical protein